MSFHENGFFVGVMTPRVTTPSKGTLFQCERWGGEPKTLGRDPKLGKPIANQTIPVGVVNQEGGVTTHS